jgi:hypothetical protein
MKIPLRTALSLSVLVCAAAGCKTMAGTPESHWNIDSVPNRITTHFTGYRGPIDGNYREFQWRKKKSIDLTMRRHFLNNNPENPLEVADPSRTEVRPPFGILPDPVHYFHVESIVIGGALLAATGTFLPIPVDSLIATFTPGGTREFSDGISDTFSGDWEGELDKPAPPSKFKVRRR